MNRVLLLALVLFLGAVALAQPDPNVQGMGANPPAVRRILPLPLPDTPENGVRYFVLALSKGLELELSIAVEGARVGIYEEVEWNDVLRSIPPFNFGRGLIVDSVKVENQTENEATVTLVAYHTGVGGPGPRQSHTLQLRRVTATTPDLTFLHGKWRVVPPLVDDILAAPFDATPPLQLAAATALRDPRLMPLIRRFRNLARLKLLSLGAVQLARNFEQILAFNDAGYERALFPYTGNAALPVIAGTNGEKWHFNNYLSLKSLAELKDPAHTVLFYDGAAPGSDALTFRSDGQTLLCFADGRAQALSKDQLKDLIWKP